MRSKKRFIIFPLAFAAALLLGGCYAKTIGREDYYVLDEKTRIHICLDKNELRLYSPMELDTMNEYEIQKESYAFKELGYISYPLSSVSKASDYSIAFLTFLFLSPVYAISAPFALHEVHSSPSVSTSAFKTSDAKPCKNNLDTHGKHLYTLSSQSEPKYQLKPVK